jgi:predicted nucleotidyltransferase
MRLTKEQIVRETVRYVTEHEEIVFAYLFGSIVETGLFKDVDVGIYIGDSISDGFSYALRMSSELERRLACPVDVIVLNTAPDHLVHRISSKALIVNRDDDLRVRFLTRSWSRYFDIAVKRRAYLRAVAEGSGTHA